MSTPEPLTKLAAQLNALQKRTERSETLCGILRGQIARQNEELKVISATLQAAAVEGKRAEPEAR